MNLVDGQPDNTFKLNDHPDDHRSNRAREYFQRFDNSSAFKSTSDVLEYLKISRMLEDLENSHSGQMIGNFEVL